MTHDNGNWDFDSPIAALRCGGLAARVDVSRPQQGVYDLSVNSSKVAGTLFAIEWIAEKPADSTESVLSAGWPMGVADAYVRGCDLVATYGRMPNSPYSPQIYWRVEQGATQRVPGREQEGLSLIVSVQTDLLDSHPQIRVTTRLAADELIEHRALSIEHPASSIEHPASCLLWRLAGGKLSYAEIVPESDFRQLTVERDADGVASVHWDLFAEFLEKGVIRRARIQGAFLPRQDDIELAAACCRAIDRRALPLTT
ncbi:MAG: hypothetical protein WD669_06975 [Pirellulales bacterium]